MPNHARELVSRYRAFYRADKKMSARGCVKPLHLASEVLVKSIQMNEEELIDAISARLMKLMNQCRSFSGAEGYPVLDDVNEELAAIREFAQYFVVEVFDKAFNGDRGRYCGRQEGYLKDICEYIYREMQYAEWKEKKELTNEMS